MSNYTLYAMFNHKIERKLEEIINKTHEAFPGIIESKPTEVPHMTILHGPELPADGKELTTYDEDAIETLYPSLTDTKAKYMDLRFTGVSHFKRAVGYIIKFEFASDRLTDLTMTLRENHPAVDAAYLKAHETDGDLSRGSTPVRWLHTTIGIVKNAADVPAVEEFVRNLALNNHNPIGEDLSIPIGLTVDRFVVMSAVTDTPINIPNTNL